MLALSKEASGCMLEDDRCMLYMWRGRSLIIVKKNYYLGIFQAQFQCPNIILKRIFNNMNRVRIINLFNYDFE